MADTVTRLTRAAALLEQRGVPVERRAGWRTRGREALTPAGHVEHDTADPAVLSRTRMLQLLADGHGSLTNALCTWAVPRERPAAVLIAARTAWHAGRGSWRGVSGNRRMTGTEIQRAQGQTITAAQWEIAEQITRAMVECFGYPASMVCTHNEWTPRKTDPHGLDGHRWRNRIVASRPQPTPDPEPTTWIEDIMATGEAQLDRIADALERDATARHAQAAVDAAQHSARVRDQYGLDPDPHSDGIQGDRVAGGKSLKAVGDDLLDKAGTA